MKENYLDNLIKTCSLDDEKECENMTTEELDILIDRTSKRKRITERSAISTNNRLSCKFSESD